MFLTVVVCFSVLQVVISQELPSKCWNSNDTELIDHNFDPLICCPLPDVFKKEEFRECGLKYKSEDHGEPEIKSMEDYCNRLKCLLNKHDLMEDEINVDKEAVGIFMDKWADTNEDFREAVKIAKDKCLREDLSKKFEEAYDLCQPNIFVYCTSLTVYSNCPIWQDRHECTKIKEYIDDCGPLIP